MDSYLEQLQRVLAVSLADISEEELGWHSPEKWCAGEVLEHLYLTYTWNLKGFGRVIQAGKPLATLPTLWQRCQVVVAIDFGYLPEGRKAPARTQPRGLSAKTVRNGIILKIAELDEIITHCEQQWGLRRKLLDHPILGPLNAGQWRKFHLVHGLHHVGQIQRLRQAQASMKETAK
jgi:hypothetical protein